MAPFIDLDDLQQKLDQEKEAVQTWVQARTDSAQAISSEHVENAQRQSGALATVRGGVSLALTELHQQTIR